MTIHDEKGALGIAGSIFLLVTAGIVIVGMTYYGGDMLQRAQTESKIGQHARQASTFGQAVAEFVDAKGDGLSDGRHVYKPGDFKSLGFLPNSFDNKTPWGETFVAYLYKNGDEISGVISEYGDVDKKAVKTVMDTVNDKTLRALKLKVALKRVKMNPTSDDVPGVGKDGLADGVKGMFEDIDISTYVSDDTPRYVSLMNVDGLGSIPSIGEQKLTHKQYLQSNCRIRYQLGSRNASGSAGTVYSNRPSVGVNAGLGKNVYAGDEYGDGNDVNAERVRVQATCFKDERDQSGHYDYVTNHCSIGVKIGSQAGGWDWDYGNNRSVGFNDGVTNWSTAGEWNNDGWDINAGRLRMRLSCGGSSKHKTYIENSCRLRYGYNQSNKSGASGWVGEMQSVRANTGWGSWADAGRSGDGGNDINANRMAAGLRCR